MATTASPIKDLVRGPLTMRPSLGPARRTNPIVLWHLLSLDAPTVAALWTWFLARANHIRLPASSILAMAIAVWMLYAADRLLDTRARLHSSLPEQEFELEARHHFHRSNDQAFASGIVVAALALFALLPRLPWQSLLLYLVLAALLAVYFVVIHSSANSRRLPKEIAVGVFFSAATFIPTVSRQPELRLALLPAAILFAVLCSLNCLFIYAWEHPRSLPSPRPATHPATEAALRFLPIISLAAVLAGFTLCLADAGLQWQIPAACGLSISLLLVLHGLRNRFNSVTLRAAADLCLLTPILFLPLLSR